MPLTLTDLSYSTLAADVDGDGLDDLLTIDWTDGIRWMENISDQ
jgi:hypothetical protein